MYVKSIKENSKYLVPYIEGVKYYYSDEIEHSIATMIVLNESGDLLTCRHVAENFINENVNTNKELSRIVLPFEYDGEIGITVSNS